MDKDMALAASGTGLSSSTAPEVAALRASIPSAEQADRLGEILSSMDERWMTDTTRAVALVGEWEQMKERGNG